MIVYACADLLFATKIRATAEAAGIASRPARNAAMLQQRLDRVDDGKLNDAVTGVLVDLAMGEPALALIAQVKHHDATIPVVAFGSHVDTAALQSARDHGADFVMPRGQFTGILPAILERLGGTKV